MSTPAGWYPDTDVPGGQRYWNGSSWTEDRAAPPPAPTPTAYAQAPTAYAAVPPTSGLAVAALVAALIVPLVGLILGYVARNDIRNSGGTKSGEGLATAAIVIGWVVTVVAVGFLLIVLVLFILGGRVASSFDQTNSTIGLILGW